MQDSVLESYFWKQVKAGLGDMCGHLSRIENTAGTGISDVNMCYQGREVWVELKVFHGNKLHFRTSQRAWISKHVACGGSVMVLARKDDLVLVYPAMDCLNAPHKVANDCKSFSVDYADLPNPICSCGKPFRWKEVRNALVDSW